MVPLRSLTPHPRALLSTATPQGTLHHPLVAVKYLFLEPYFTRQLKDVSVSISHIVSRVFITTVGSQKPLKLVSVLTPGLWWTLLLPRYSPSPKSRIESHPSYIQQGAQLSYLYSGVEWKCHQSSVLEQFGQWLKESIYTSFIWLIIILIPKRHKFSILHTNYTSLIKRSL